MNLQFLFPKFSLTEINSTPFPTNFGGVISVASKNLLNAFSQNNKTQTNLSQNQTRGVIYYTHSKAERRSVRAVVERFYRLHWGGWIQVRPGRHKRLWQKPHYVRWNGRQHILLNQHYCLKLDKMTTWDFKLRKHFVDDPYEPYHVRHGLEFLPPGKESDRKHYSQVLFDYRPEKPKEVNKNKNRDIAYWPRDESV